ncbi:phasin family protein [Cupriavidus lacunae]|uniref:Phasin family protein n=1 Tax=Cupriavidus lacunae TaxID=2666307 RepID=A0A370NLF0_9BURK|nr:phasin family protein [Cupriavidus lacunae]RDK06368.1 phasin family protein [Cupriavidus lacunae]
MTQWSPEQFIKVQMAGIETLTGLTGKAFEGFEKLLELNLQTVKTALAETREGAKKALFVKDPHELVELQIELLQPAADNVLAYRRQLYEIFAATRAEFEKGAEVQYAAGKQGLQDFLGSVVNITPAGPAAPLAAWQEAVNATATLYESMQTTAKQAVKLAESSFSTAAEAASKGMQRRATQASKAAV